MEDNPYKQVVNFESLKNILNLSPLGITILVKSTSALSFVNTAFLHFLDYTPQQLAPSDLYSIFPEGFFSMLQERLSQSTDENRYFLDEVKFVAKNGQVRFFNIYSDELQIDAGEVILSYYRDVTEKIHTQNLLARSESCLKDAQKVAKMGNWEWNLTDEPFYSEELLNIYNFSSASEFTFDAFISLLHPEDKQRVTQIVGNALYHYMPYELNYRIIMPSGQVKYLRSMAEAFLDPHNQPYKMVGTVQDITEQVRTQQTLERSEKALKQAQSVAKVGSWEWDILEDTRSYSDELLNIYGLGSFDAFTMYTLIDRLHPEDKMWVNDVVEKALFHFESYDIRFRIILPSGEIKHLHGVSQAYRTQDNQPYKMVGTVQDITEQVRTQQTLERSEKALKQAQSVAKVGSWEWDILEDTRSYSDELLNIFGFTIGTVYSYEQFIEQYHPDDRERVVKYMQDAIKYYTPFDIHYRIILPSGELKYIQASSKLYKDSQQKPLKMIGTVQDITDQVLAKQALEKSEKRLIRAQQIGRMGYWEWNIDKDELYWSDQLYLLYDISKKDFTPSVSNFIEMIYEPEREKNVAYINTCLENHQTHYQIEAQIITYSGKKMHVMAKAEIFYDAAGNPIRMEGVSQDITSAKKAEEDLLYKDYLLQNVNDAIFSTDAQLTITSWNKAAETIYGWSAKEAVGENLAKILHFNGVDAAAHQDFFENGYFKGKHTLQKKNGSKVVVEAYTQLLKNEQGEFTGMVSVDRDLTDFSEIQSRVQQTEYMLQLVLDTIPQGIYWKDLHLRYQGCNNKFIQMLGLSDSSDILLKTDKELLWEANEQNTNKDLDRQLISGSTPKQFFTEQIQTKDKRTIWVDVKRVPLYNKEKQIIGLLGSLEDITHKKLVEEELHTYRANLEAVIENTNDLIWALDRNFQIIALNSNLTRFWQTYFGTSIKKGDNFSELQPGWLQQQWMNAFGRVLRGEKIQVSKRVNLQGKYYWFDISCFPIREDNGHIRGASYMVRDVTERKKQELLLIKYIKQHSKLKLEQEKLQMLAVVKGQEEERRIISRELHDGVGQMLTALHFKTNKLSDKLQPDTELTLLLSDISKLQKNIYNEVRRISENLMPQFLNDFSLEEALKQLTLQVFNSTHIRTEPHYELEGVRLEKSLEIAIFRITQEIFTNILKHSQATHVIINLQLRSSVVFLLIKDNGIGTDLNKNNHRGKGLNNIKQRVNLLNGTLTVSSLPGEGFQLLIKIPIRIYEKD